MTTEQYNQKCRPIVTGLSPKEGPPGTQVTIRGENLGVDGSDVIALMICKTDCLLSAKWKSSSKLIARIGAAKRGIGEVMIATKSGGMGISNVTFRVVMLSQVGVMEESAVWIDESRSVPGREVMRNVAPSTELHPLALTISNTMDTALLSQMFPEGSGNMRLDNFVPSWYLLENHRNATVDDLRRGLVHMRGMSTSLDQSAKELHKANLYSLISCVDSLAELQSKLQLERNTRGWPLTRDVDDKIAESRTTADQLFHGVLSRKDRADATRNALSVLTRFRFIFFLPSTIDSNLAKGDYGAILNDYARAKSLFGDSDVALFREVMQVLEEKMNKFKMTLKNRLMDSPTSFEEQRKTIRYLQILEPNSDPAWDCLTAHHVYLEQLLWQAQTKFFLLANNAANSLNGDNGKKDSSVLDTGSNGHRYPFEFAEAVMAVLTEKLHGFWKLTQAGSGSNNNSERESDVQQMLINTINVSSWLILNALVSTSLPDSVLQQYREHLVKWPMRTMEDNGQLLFSALRQLRACVKKLMEQQFTLEHVQPLVELCMTIRLKCLSKLVETTRMGIISLGNKENWKTEVMDNSPECFVKTNLPDFYENELIEALPNMQQILAHDGFRGELDLFSRDKFKEMLLDLFELLLTSVKECIEQLLQLHGQRSSTILQQMNRPISFESKEQALTGRKLLITVCNLEYIIRCSLARLCRRLSDCGIKYADVILQRSKQKLQSFRSTLIRSYISMKCRQFSALIENASYDGYVPDDVSDYVKEVVMCVVFIQAEIYLVSPQLIVQIMNAIVRGAMDTLISFLRTVPVMDEDHATQMAIDISAFEESLHSYFTDEMRGVANALRADLLSKIEQKRFQRSLQSYRTGMRMAIDSLQHFASSSSSSSSNDNTSSSSNI